MQENPLVPSDPESDGDLADTIEQQYLPKTPSSTSTATERSLRAETPMRTRAAGVKRPTNYPIQEPPLTKRKGNPTRSHTEIMNKLDQCDADNKTILANQEVLRINQENIIARLDRMTKMIIDCQTRMSVAEIRIQGMQEARKEATTGPQATTSQDRSTEPDVTPHAHVGSGTDDAPCLGAGAFF
ncbi:putative polymerase co-factor [Formica fusca virus 1]|uniref:Putative polymerase co-factor n=1 Tax=Formica fusca virus 1 TaxID=2018499 RepID=A0A3G5FMG1_9MONO|nr:putative polymerase co-factor [Formica fusca virus 1]AYW51535.1 putative polymerase co-factor [Formica fusca virus 1]